MLEVTRVLTRASRIARHSTTIDAAIEQLNKLDLLPLQLEQQHYTRIWDIRNNINPYDGAYVALAESFGIPFYTADKRLISAIHNAAPTVKAFNPLA